MRKKLFLILAFFGLVSCKKTIDVVDDTPSTEIIGGSEEIHSFTISISQLDTTSVTISWTDAGDYQSDSVTYTLILNDKEIAKNVKVNTYKISHLQRAATYHLEIRASKMTDEFVTVRCDFVTDDGYMKFQDSFYDDVVPYDIAVAPDGGYVVCMFDGYPLNGGLRVSKFDSSGNEVWKKVFHYKGRGSKIRAADDGYIIMSDTCLFKINFEGDQVWYQSVGRSDLVSFSINKKNEIVVTGFENSSDPTGAVAIQATAWLFSGNGTLEWKKIYGSSHVSQGCDIISTADNDGYYLIGSRTVPTSGTVDGKPVTISQYWLLKLDNSGNLIWNKTFETPGYAFPRKLLLINENLIIGGYSSQSGLDGDMEIFRTDLDGNILKSAVIEPAAVYTKLQSVEATSDAGYIVCGTVGQFKESTLLGLYKYDSADKLVWSKTYPFQFSYWTDAYAVKQTEDKGYIIPATKFQLYGAKPDLWLLKLNPSGSYE